MKNKIEIIENWLFSGKRPFWFALILTVTICISLAAFLTLAIIGIQTIALLCLIPTGIVAVVGIVFAVIALYCSCSDN